MLAELFRTTMRGMKAPMEAYPLVIVVSGAAVGGTFMAFRKLATDPHLRRHETNARTH